MAVGSGQFPGHCQLKPCPGQDTCRMDKEQEWEDLYLTGVDASYTSNITYGFEMMTADYTSKDQVWKALADNPSLAVVNTSLVPTREGGGGLGARSRLPDW